MVIFQEEKEEVKKNWPGIFISLGIITTVLMLVTVATLIIGPMQAPLFTGRRLILSDLQNDHLVALPMPTQWLPGIFFMSKYIFFLFLRLNITYKRFIRVNK